MLSDAERAVLNTALEKYRPGQAEAILVGGKKVLKPALRLMTLYRLAIEEIKDSQAITSYTRWVDAVQVTGAENQEVYLMFSPRFEHIWIESKKSLLDFACQKPAHIGLRSQYALRMYSWARNQASAGTKRITLEELRTVLGLDSVKDAEGNVIREARLTAWANFRNRALYTAIGAINKKTDLNITLKAVEQAEHGGSPRWFLRSGRKRHQTLFQKEDAGSNAEHDAQISSRWDADACARRRQLFTDQVVSRTTAGDRWPSAHIRRTIQGQSRSAATFAGCCVWRYFPLDNPDWRDV